MRLTASALPARLLPFVASAALHAALLLGAGALLVAPGPAVEKAVRNVLYVSLSVKASPAPSPVYTEPQRRAERAPVAPRAMPEPRAPTPAAVAAIEVSTPPPPAIAIAPSAREGGPAVMSPASSTIEASDAGPAADATPSASADWPAYLRAPEPSYPQAAREDEQEGLVILRVLVSRDGRPAQIRVAASSGFRLLDAAAVAGVRGWTFVPARDGSRAIEAWMEVPVRFQLR